MARHATTPLRKPRKAMVAGVASISLLVGSGLVAASAPATAASVDGLTWSTGLGYHGDLSLAPDGGVVVNQATHNGDAPAIGADSLTGVAASGTATWHVPYAEGDTVLLNPVVDAAGNTYRYQYNAADRSKGFIIASNGPVTLWTVAAPVDASGHLEQLVVGANNQLYDLVDSTLYSYLASTGKAARPPVTVESDGNIPFTQIYAYDKGFVAYSGPSIKYLDFNGVATSGPIQLPPSRGEQFNHLAVSATGDVFLASSALQPGGGCADDAKIVATKATRSGTAWSMPVAAIYPCTVTTRLAPTPNGGVVLDGIDGGGNTLVQAFSSDGKQLWHTVLTAPRDSFWLDSLLPRVDVNGQIVIPEMFHFDCNLPSDRCSGIRLSRLNASGTIIDQPALRGPASDLQQSWSLWESDQQDGVALSPGQAIASLLHQDGGEIWGKVDYRVGAMAMPGLGAQYPEAALWKLMSEVGAPLPSAGYVALGDSFSAGEGAAGPGGYIKGSDDAGTNKCHRSNKAYSVLSSKVKGMPDSFAIHACSGAIIEDFFAPFPANHSDSAGKPVNVTESHAQLDWLNSETRVVTFTIGGNSALFPEVMAYCAARAYWEESCKKRFAPAVDEALDNLARSSQGRIQDNLPDLYSAIAAKAPNAKILALGYPRFFPRNRKTDCYTGIARFRFFQSSDMKWINSEILKMNNIIKNAASKFEKITYVNQFDAFDGHELCTEKPYLNDGRVIDQASSYHPNVQGQARLASVLRPYLP